MSKKKKKSSIKKPKPCKKKCGKVCTREKVCGEPVPVKPLTYTNGEPYPKLIFKPTLWNRFLRFLGLVP